MSWISEVSAPHLLVALHEYKPPSVRSVDRITSLEVVNLLPFSSLLCILWRHGRGSGGKETSTRTHSVIKCSLQGTNGSSLTRWVGCIIRLRPNEKRKSISISLFSYSMRGEGKWDQMNHSLSHFLSLSLSSLLPLLLSYSSTLTQDSLVMLLTALMPV